MENKNISTQMAYYLSLSQEDRTIRNMVFNANNHCKNDGYKVNQDIIGGLIDIAHDNDDRCPLCNRKMKMGEGTSKKSMSLDHIIPISQGGDNSIVNLRIICLDCNRTRRRGKYHRGGENK